MINFIYSLLTSQSHLYSLTTFTGNPTNLIIINFKKLRLFLSKVAHFLAQSFQVNLPMKFLSPHSHFVLKTTWIFFLGTFPSSEPLYKSIQWFPSLNIKTNSLMWLSRYFTNWPFLLFTGSKASFPINPQHEITTSIKPACGLLQVTAT